MYLLILFLFSYLNVAFAAGPQSAVVVVPIADVWSRPLAPAEKPSDDLRETQVLFGEKVIIHESSGTWALIEAVEQPEYTHHNRWEGYPGWVLRTTLSQGPLHFNSVNILSNKLWEFNEQAGTELPIGSKIHYSKELAVPVYTPLPSRNEILKISSLFIGIPYLWGGMTGSGLDCSGLVYLSYVVNGMTVSRDSHEQWMKAKPIKRAELKPADLIFSAKADNPKKITHVALFAGYEPPHPPLSPSGARAVVDGQIIEAPQTGMVVRKISFQEKYGKPLEKVESGDKVGDRVIYFGSFLQK